VPTAQATVSLSFTTAQPPRNRLCGALMAPQVSKPSCASVLKPLMPLACCSAPLHLPLPLLPGCTSFRV